MLHFDNAQGWMQTSHRTEIKSVYEDEQIEQEWFFFQWPQSAIDEVNKMVLELNISFSDAEKVVSKSLDREKQEKQEKKENEDGTIYSGIDCE